MLMGRVGPIYLVQDSLWCGTSAAGHGGHHLGTLAPNEAAYGIWWG